MKICCISDLHGYLPQIPDCDLLLLTGDYCPFNNLRHQLTWFFDKFRPWLASIECPVVGIAGNHDFLFERNMGVNLDFKWHYLQNSTIEIMGLKIFGSPETPRFFDWAFNREEHELEQTWGLIPADVDVVLSHGPPLGYGDLSPDGRHCGSESLTRRLEVIQPRLVVCGHIHHSYGRYNLGKTTILNASYCDEQYQPVNPLVVIDWEEL